MHRLHASLEELLAFTLDGQPLLLATRQHIDRCPSCQRKLTSCQRTTQALLPKLYRSHCPSATDLSYYCLPDGLTAQERLRITEHLAHCPLCMHELAETRAFLGVA
jgi:uncharacterized protein with PIN domain